MNRLQRVNQVNNTTTKFHRKVLITRKIYFYRIIEPNTEPEGSSEPSSESEPEPGSANGNRVYKQHAYAPKHDFNPMDCTDIVIGTARNQSSRIYDYYTRDRYELHMHLSQNIDKL